MPTKFFVRRVFDIFVTDASFWRVIANLQVLLSKICNIFHIIMHFLPKKHCFLLFKKALFCAKISKKCVNRDKS